MNQTYFEWYEFDVNFVRIITTTCTCTVVVNMNELRVLWLYFNIDLCSVFMYIHRFIFH